MAQAAKARADFLNKYRACKTTILEIQGVGESNKVSLASRQTNEGHIAVKFSIQSGQKFVLSGMNLPLTAGVFFQDNFCETQDMTTIPTSYNFDGPNKTIFTLSVSGTFLFYYGLVENSINEFVWIE